MEEFWNCADITILPKGSKVPPPPKPKPMSKEELAQNEAQNAALRAARQQQANELRRQAKSLTGSQRDLVMGQVKMLEDIAKGKAGEGFTNFVPRYYSLSSYRDAIANTARFSLRTGEAVIALVTSIAAIVMPTMWTLGLAAAVISWIATAKARIRESWQNGGVVIAWPWQVNDLDDELKLRMMVLKMPSVPSSEPIRRASACHGS